MLDRRRVLQGAALGGLALATGSWRAMAAASGTGWFAHQHLPIGLQLYTVGDAARQNLDDTLAKVSQIGYRTIELAGYHGHSVDALHAAALRYSLKYTSIHVGAVSRPGEPGLDQDVPKLAAELHKLGVTDVIMPMFTNPEPRRALTRADWQRTAAFLNDRGKKFRSEGLRFGYHNHNPEFAPIDDTNGLEILLAETTPEDVTFEMDVGWVAAGGVDPVALLTKHTRRFQLMHVKDVRPTTKTNYTLQQDPTEVGAGRLDWPRLLPAAFKAGVRKFYVEQEPPFEGDRFTSIAKSYRYLSAFETANDA